MPTAPASARLGDEYDTIKPSPRFFTSVPPEAVIAPRSNRKWVWRNSSAAAGPRRAAVAVESTRSVNTNVAVTDADKPPTLPKRPGHRVSHLPPPNVVRDHHRPRSVRSHSPSGPHQGTLLR